MAKGPYSRIVIKRPNGETEIIGRPGHLDPTRAIRELSPMGEVLRCSGHPACEGPHLREDHEQVCDGGSDCDNDWCWCGCQFCNKA